ncbi:MAG TPA: hypothetical protein VGF34_07110 [Stellaceae bacterium]|jgi:hypothetical protein
MTEAELRVETNPDTAYEPSDWSLPIVGLVLVGIIVFLVAGTLVLIVAFPGAVSGVSRKLTAEPPAPRLQLDPAKDLARFRADEERRLDTYYWIDKKKGIVHIPIAEAMKEVAAKGLAGFPKASP